jgi:putative salt-induced outer membrane protein
MMLVLLPKKDVFAVYDAAYYISGNSYGFSLGRIEQDGIADTVDAFVGVAPGYRIVNTERMAWRVQAGVGQTYSDVGGASTTEIGYIVSSRMFYASSENVFVSNDTDILKSASKIRGNNDLGLSVKISDTVSTRVSLLSDYDDSRASKIDNKVGVSLVFDF